MATTKKSKSKPATTPSPDTIRENRARIALSASTNAAVVIHSYQGNIAGKDTDMQFLLDGLHDTFSEVKAGDLSGLEAMLISQATALQTIFTSLARRAAHQEHFQLRVEKFPDAHSGPHGYFMEMLPTEFRNRVTFEGDDVSADAI